MFAHSKIDNFSVRERQRLESNNKNKVRFLKQTITKGFGMLKDKEDVE